MSERAPQRAAGPDRADADGATQAATGGSTERLHKVLAHAGVASRRTAERLVVEGRVRVDGVVVAEPGTPVDPQVACIEVDGRRVQTAARPHRYVVLNKPVGVVSTARDPQGRPTVVDLARSDRRLYPVGRLDVDSEGLVLLTDDGDLTYRLTHARFEVEKEYHALVGGAPSLEQVRQLAAGVQLVDGPARAVRAEVLRTTPAGAWVRVVMHEGRKREVRRMLDAIGLPVLALRRARIGPLSLGSLRPGAARALRQSEVAALRQAVGLPPDGPRA